MSLLAKSIVWSFLGGCALRVLASDPPPSAEAVAAQAARRAQDYTFSAPVPAVNPEEAEHARALADAARTRARQSFKDWQTRGGGAAATVPARATGAAAGSAVPGPAPMSGRLIVAVSSSMPMSMLQDYMQQLAGVPEAVVVLRGFIGGAQKVAPTGKWLEETRRVVPSCLNCEHYNVQVLVDPLVYRALRIEQVPAVAFVPGVSDISHCDGEQLKAGAVAYGAVSIESALQTLARSGVELPAGLLEKVRRRGWESKTAKHSG